MIRRESDFATFEFGHFGALTVRDCAPKVPEGQSKRARAIAHLNSTVSQRYSRNKKDLLLETPLAVFRVRDPRKDTISPPPRKVRWACVARRNAPRASGPCGPFDALESNRHSPQRQTEVPVRETPKFWSFMKFRPRRWPFRPRPTVHKYPTRLPIPDGT